MEEVAHCNTQGRVQAGPQRSPQQGTLASEVPSNSDPHTSSTMYMKQKNSIEINTKINVKGN